MNNKRYISLLIFCLIFKVVGYSQDQVKILDNTDRLLGRFKTQLYEVRGAKLLKLKGSSPEIEAQGEVVELLLRLQDLSWFEDEHIESSIQISRSDIKPSDVQNIQISSERSQYTLKPSSKIDVDIKFKVFEDGDFSLTVPFAADEINGKFLQSFKMVGIKQPKSSNKQIGEVADIKKEWKNTNKKDVQAITKFIKKYENNSIAKKEGILNTANKTLTSLQKKNGTETASSVQSASQVKTDQEAWDELGDSNDEELLREFLENYPDSKYADAARAKLGEDANVLIVNETETLSGDNSLTKKDNNIYTLDLSHLKEVDITFSDADDIELFKNGGNIFDLKVNGSKLYTINVNEKATGNKYSFKIDNRFKAKIDNSGNDFVFSIEGGVAPFTAEFFKGGESESHPEARFDELLPDIANQITITYEKLSSSGMEGKYEKVILRDFTTESIASFPINADVSPKKTNLLLILGLLIGAIIIGGGAMFFFNKKKQTKRSEYLKRAQEMHENQKVMANPMVKMINEEPDKKISPKKITINRPDKVFVPSNGGDKIKASGKMKITKRDVIGGFKNAEQFEEALKANKYAHLDLTELWPDTAIKELYISNECIKALGKFLKEENLDKAIVEMEGAIPEVGGFLMGFHQEDKSTGEIKVTMEEFVPFVPEYHDVFKIEIGTATLVQELGDAQDHHPDKDVIGWFHTHPGHGLFLSNSDLSVQRHFPQKFQIAMEIDSLTNTLDAAFFTRKMNGTINNVEHRRKGAKWFSWKKIENI